MVRRHASARLAVLCSGQGTNLQAILDACEAPRAKLVGRNPERAPLKRGESKDRSPRLKAQVAVVISDRPDAYALRRARRAGADARYFNPHDYSTRGAYERVLIACLNSYGVRLICLAGFMRILSPVFVHAFRNRILNIHPALLPAFPGAHAVRDALAWGVKVTGVTVHLVNEKVDYGPIVLQEAVVLAPRDTEASLLARIHQIEHQLYPKAIQLILERRVKVVGRRVVRV